jgi:ribosomal RNA-processing protein 1
MLVRRFVNASFRLLERSEWSATACNDYNDILSGQEGPLACVFLACNLLIFAED